MSPAKEPALSRLERLLDGCRRGLNHDLANQLLPLQGLLQLLESEESERLSPTGKDYLRRLLGVAERTQALARTLRELAQLRADSPRAELVALPELAEEVFADVPRPLDCTLSWEAPRVQAPRLLLQRALAQALRLLLEAHAGGPAYLNCSSRPANGGVELSIEVRSASEAAPLATTPVPLSADLPRVWHERVECLLLRELAETWGGTVEWQKVGDGLRVTFTLPPPR
jgi:signal transduction histidine kinase